LEYMPEYTAACCDPPLRGTELWSSDKIESLAGIILTSEREY
jgi:hypothetical protein